MHSSLVGRDFVVIDFEAVTPRGGPPLPIEVAAVLISGDPDAPGRVLADELIALDDPGLLTGLDTQQTGITREMLSTARSVGEVLGHLGDATPPGALLVAHNASFERNVLMSHPACPPRLSEAQFVGTLRLARDVLRGRGPHDLDTLARRFGVPVPADRHRALPDVQVTCGVFHHLIDEVGREHPEISWHALLGRMALPPRASTAPATTEAPQLFDL